MNKNEIDTKARALAQQRKTELNNPCAKESKISMQCLDKNNYDKKKCELEFANYKYCKSFWYYVKRDRIDKNLPLEMSEEEKNQVKQDLVKEIEMKAKHVQHNAEEWDRKFKKKSKDV